MKLNVLYVCDENFNFPDAKVAHIKEIHKNLNSIGVNTILVKPMAEEEEFKSYSLFNRLIYQLLLIILLPYYILKKKISMIYIRQNPILIVPQIISTVFSVPFIVEVNGTLIEQLKMNKTPKFIVCLVQFVEHLTYKFADKIIVSSKELAGYINKKYPFYFNKVHCLENGVDTNLFKQKDKLSCRKQLSLNLNSFYGGYIGGLFNWQGVDYLIKSTSEIIKIFPNYKIIIVGEGPEKEKLINLTKELHLEKSIIFKGGVKHCLIPKYINSFDISFCYLTKINEGNYGTPFKIYEYLSCGSPVVMSDIKGITTLFKNHVLLSRPEDEKDLAKQVIKLLKDKRLRKSLSIAGRNFILEGHSWKDVAKKTEKIIRGVLRRNES